MFFTSSFVFLITLLIITKCNGLSYQPEQVHLSFGENVTEIVVTWSTKNNTKVSTVQYGIENMLLTAKGTSRLFVDGGSKHNSQYIHRVTLLNLLPNNIYSYQCGSSLGWSSKFWFKSVSSDSNWSPHLAIYGDLGYNNGLSIPPLIKETQMGLYDTILHIGDFAYDFRRNEGEVGDAFLRQIEPITAHVPYMTSPGNHENAYNFSHYRERFSMPGGTENLMYSFDLGPLHIISISTEFYYYLKYYGTKSLIYQYEWLEKDLIKATLTKNRNKRPWIIVMGHRPMYCSTTDGDDCNNHNTKTRIGLPGLRQYGLENLLYNYGVDLEIWAHEHVYQRLWPIYDYAVYNGSYEEPYKNPKAPIHVIAGSAGCLAATDTFNESRPAWSAFESTDYGYARLKAHNSTHLYLEQVSVDRKGDIVDSFWIVKDSHEAYPHTNKRKRNEKLRMKNVEF